MSNYGPKMQELLSNYIAAELVRMDKATRYNVLYDNGKYVKIVERANMTMLGHMTELREVYDSSIKNSSDEEVAEYILEALERYDGEHS